VNRVEGARVIAASEHGTSGEVAYGELQGKGADEGGLGTPPPNGGGGGGAKKEKLALVPSWNVKL
jgi:hypothetical protein